MQSKLPAMRFARLTLPLAGLCLFAAATAAEPLPRFATHVRTNISCDDTPFGRNVTLGGEDEALAMIATSGTFNAFDEYQPVAAPNDPPLARTFRSSLFPGALAGTTFLKAVGIDLDGDGRDEIVTANKVAGSNALRLGVFHRNGTPAAELAGTWTLTESITGADLAVGDFDGSTDGKQELGVLVRTTTGLQAYVLTGAADGTIAQGDNVYAGRWSRAGAVGQVGFAAGDLLLDGRAQAVIVADTGSGDTRTLNYHLLEFQPTTAALPIAGGDDAIGSILFQSVLGFTYQAENGSPGIDQIDRIEADAGDVVDSAAAELVVHMLFSQGDYDYLGQRLHHFTTTRDGTNAITAIGFASRGTGQEYDASRLIINQHEGATPSFEAAIANIDRVSPSEIVLVKSAPNTRLDVEAYKAEVDLAAGYLYTVDNLTAQFENTSTGTIATNSWDFGDASGVIHEPNPVHLYTSAGNKTVTLTITDNLGATRTYQQSITVGAGQHGTGGSAPGFMYHVVAAPAYAGQFPVAGENDLQNVNVAVGDMDKDGIAEIVTISRNQTQELLRTVWHLTDTSNPASFSGRFFFEDSNDFNSLTALDLVAADFDGDSVEATLGTDCRQVEEPQLRQVVWLPPYFQHLQANAAKYGSFGKSTSGGSNYETQSGSFTSHDVSAYLGVTVGGEVLGIGAEVSAKVTAGYNYQSAYGAIHGTENSFQVDQGFSQDSGEALTVIEDNSYNCFSYDVHSAAGGTDAGSGARMCEVIEGSRLTSASDARTWDTSIAAATPDHPPAQWFPLQRDWASIALFRPVSSNATFVAGSGADKASDGKFSTEAQSSGGDSAHPYLQIDLGSVQDVSNIRVFPAADHAAAMTGFRVYASAQPMTGDGVPGGATVTMYAPETADDVTYDRWNIWTRDRANPSNTLRARYIRLQHPGNATLRVAEIEVFGDTHVEPPTYPDAVCDPVKNDGWFNALVWDAGAAPAQFRSIEVRGDLLWNGSGPMPGCTNYSGLRTADIWDGTAIGASGSQDWNLSQSSTNLVGENTSFESSTRVGAEFDLQAGFVAQVVAGGAYEFTTGVTEETQTTSFWGSGLEIGGAIGGFDAAYASLVGTCRYTPRPYAYRLVERSNTGYRHDVYAVDYVVREGPGRWLRSSVPVLCQHDDAIFASGFE
jgi:PKD repeat protein